MTLPERFSRYLPYSPAAVALILAIPVVGFTYLWDDYNFLTNAVFYQLHDWLPASDDPFYRPISRGVYFSLLDLAGRGGAGLGHVLNMGFLLGIVILLGSFVARIAGRKAGIMAGILFAGLGAAPALVAWTCLDQDLLAILFTLIALHLRLSQRNGLALIAIAAGLLSKETTLAVIPAFVLFDWILDRKPYRIVRHATVYAALIAAWGAIHPAIRILVSRGLRSGATGYVGLEHPERWPIHAARYLMSFLNVPAFWPVPEWPLYGVVLLIAGGTSAYFIVRQADSEIEDSSPSPTVSQKRFVWLAVVLAAGPLILTSAMIRGWAPYYAAFPAVGFSMAAGVGLASLPLRTQLAVLGIYLTLGIWSRGGVKNPEESTESNFQLVDTALKKVESGFRRLYPQFPPNTQVVLSVQARGRGSIYIHMYAFQVLRIWYRDRTLRAVRPEERTRPNGPELLTLITPDWDVVDIDPRTLFARSASRREPDYYQCEGAVRAYAVGLAGSGQTDDAVGLLLHLPEINAGLQSVHRRMAAMLLYADRRDQAAAAILDSTVTLPRGLALADLRAVLAEQPKGRMFDDHGLRAFGISAQDTTAIRELMRWFVRMKYVDVALRFAERLNTLSPGDAEAEAVRRKMIAILEMRKHLPKGASEVD